MLVMDMCRIIIFAYVHCGARFFVYNYVLEEIEALFGLKTKTKLLVSWSGGRGGEGRRRGFFLAELSPLTLSLPRKSYCRVWFLPRMVSKRVLQNQKD